MKILVIDTALGACTAAVFDGDIRLAERSEPMTKGHQERIAGMVRDVAAEAGVAFETIDRIGVTTGPGSFTGLRVGLAFAQGLGAALDRPVVGISTLDALAASLDDAGGAVAAVIDARRGQVYVRQFSDGAPVSTAEALSIKAAVERLSAGGPWRLAGSGAPVLLEQASTLGEAFILLAPTPKALARLTIAADPASALPSPQYLRAPDATPPTRLPGQARTPPPKPQPALTAAPARP